MSEVRIVPLHEFVGVEEPSAEPLLGIRGETILPAGGRLLMYGDGGAGKTTLTTDAIAHLAAGITWLGLEVPQPIRFLIIENEGPRGMFRVKLGERILDWTGPPFRENVHVLEDPWAQFTFADRHLRDPVATYIEQHGIDVLVAGPLATLGPTGGGTPSEVGEFVALLDTMRRDVTRPYADWFVHHENKAGDVSGAWERVPDTLVHVVAQGNGHTQLRWRKVRHSSQLHDTTMNLTWSDGKSYQIVENRTRDLHAELIAAFADDNEWRTAKEASTLISANADRVRDALSDLVERGDMLYEQGPPGRSRSAKCWRLRTDSDAPSQSESVAPLEGASTGLTRPTRPKRESVETSQFGSARETDSDPASHTLLDVPLADDPKGGKPMTNDART